MSGDLLAFLMSHKKHTLCIVCSIQKEKKISTQQLIKMCIAHLMAQDLTDMFDRQFYLSKRH